jgi:quinohemoprotein ethanol dehydrogenase
VGKVCTTIWTHSEQQYRRLYKVAQDGKATPPPIQPPYTELVFVDDPKQAIDSAQARVGQDLYLDTCVACHGLAVIAAGGAPDLRSSNIAANLESFRHLLKSGSLQSRGMPRYQEMSDRQIEQIYWFIRQRERESVVQEQAMK